MSIPQNSLPPVPKLKYKEIRGHINSGDILLCSGKTLFSRLIKFGTKSIWSHVGFILWSHDLNRVMVMESVETRGVQIVPLSSYLWNYGGLGKPYEGDILIARHQDFTEEMLPHMSKLAVDLLGCRYGTKDIFKIGWKILSERFSKECKLPKPDHDYICSEYAYECYRSVGVHISHSCGYVTPSDFANTEKINPICLLS